MLSLYLPYEVISSLPAASRPVEKCAILPNIIIKGVYFFVHLFKSI